MEMLPLFMFFYRHCVLIYKMSLMIHTTQRKWVYKLVEQYSEGFPVDRVIQTGKKNAESITDLFRFSV